MTDDPFLAPPRKSQSEPSSQPTAQPVPPPAQPAAAPTAMPAQYQPPAAYPPPPPGQVPGQAPGQVPAGYSQPAYAQPGYPPPPPPGYYGAPALPKTWMNWVAFGCGLGALVTCISFIPAIVFGHLGLAAAKRGEADKKGFGIAGLAIGYTYLAGFIAYIAFIVILSSSDYS